MSTRTSATAVAAAATAWPEGNENPFVPTRGNGGRLRISRAFVTARSTSASTHVRTHAENARQRRRISR